MASAVRPPSLPLPSEMVSMILFHLTWKDRASFSCVNHTAYEQSLERQFVPASVDPAVVIRRAGPRLRLLGVMLTPDRTQPLTADNFAGLPPNSTCSIHLFGDVGDEDRSELFNHLLPTVKQLAVDSLFLGEDAGNAVAVGHPNFKITGTLFIRDDPVWPANMVDCLASQPLVELVIADLRAFMTPLIARTLAKIIAICLTTAELGFEAALRQAFAANRHCRSLELECSRTRANLSAVVAILSAGHSYPAGLFVMYDANLGISPLDAGDLFVNIPELLQALETIDVGSCLDFYTGPACNHAGVLDGLARLARRSVAVSSVFVDLDTFPFALSGMRALFRMPAHVDELGVAVLFDEPNFEDYNEWAWDSLAQASLPGVKILGIHGPCFSSGNAAKIRKAGRAAGSLPRLQTLSITCAHADQAWMAPFIQGFTRSRPVASLRRVTLMSGCTSMASLPFPRQPGSVSRSVNQYEGYTPLDHPVAAGPAVGVAWVVGQCLPFDGA